MEAFLIPIFIVSSLAIVAVCIVCARHFEKKRREAMKQVAESMMFTYSPKDDGALLQSFSSFHLFSQGHSKRIANVMQGSAGETELSIFDYRYTTGSGKNSHTWSQTVIVFRSDELRLPDFSLRPESFFHKIGGMFGFQDIDFDSNPVFSKKYLLRGDDEAAVRDIFSDEALNYFAERNGVSAEGEGNHLFFYRTSKRVSPQEIRPLMEDGFAVFGLFKS